MHLFYSSDINHQEIKVGKRYMLPSEEALHAIKVLRLKVGDVVFLTDGKGTFIRASISNTTKRNCEIEFLEIENDRGKRNFYVHIALAPTKNIKRFDWFLEKATEMGIDEITPIITFHSERRDLNIERSNKVITAAMKQSLKAYHPMLNEPVTFEEFIKNNQQTHKFIAHYISEEQLLLKNIGDLSNNVVVLIGPEGDFSAKEVEIAVNAKFIPVSLGNTRLRTETAALAACFTINLIKQ